MKKEEEKKEKLCGNCRNFISDGGTDIHYRGAGRCLVNQQAFLAEKMKLKAGEHSTKSVPQIFAHFHCSNNKFDPRR